MVGQMLLDSISIIQETRVIPHELKSIMVSGNAVLENLKGNVILIGIEMGGNVLLLRKIYLAWLKSELCMELAMT